MSTYAVDGDKLTAIADAIRLKRDLTTDMTLDDMPLQIGLIEGGGGAKITAGSITVSQINQLQIFPIENLNLNGTYLFFARRAESTAPPASTYANAIFCVCNATKGLQLYMGGNISTDSRLVLSPKNASDVTYMPLVTANGIQVKTFPSQYFTAGLWEYYAVEISPSKVDIYPAWWTHVTN